MSQSPPAPTDLDPASTLNAPSTDPVRGHGQMTITVQNLGVLKYATFELGNLTVICGNNNTGKTYATYALFGS